MRCLIRGDLGPKLLHYDSQPLSYTCAFMYTYMYIASLGCSPPDLLSSGVVWVPQRRLGGWC